ncbi:MAG TPA: hypothetical protein VK678_25900 [Bradyrhizobium sp.]|jgi:hypothetical protein|nr:hypothetical protein [Bradyrhizobium sp.]
MLIDVIAATIHRTPVLGFCMGAPRKRRPSQLRLLLKTYVYQGARLRTMGSSPFGEQHEWAMRELCEMTTKKGDRIGSRAIKSITPRGADKIHDCLTLGPKGPRLPTAEKIVLLCRKAWAGRASTLSEEFNKDVPNPWSGVPMKTSPSSV